MQGSPLFPDLSTQLQNARTPPIRHLSSLESWKAASAVRKPKGGPKAMESPSRPQPFSKMLKDEGVFQVSAGDQHPGGWEPTVCWPQCWLQGSGRHAAP